MRTAFLVLILQMASVATRDTISQSEARCIGIQSADERIASPAQIAPGAPPLLSFRYYEGQLHHRFGNSDLMLDDAGH